MSEVVVPTGLGLDSAPELFNDPHWEGIAAESLRHAMPGTGAHRPGTQFRVAGNERGLHLTFQVHDRYLHAETTENQGSVCRDSCVEFFFTPAEDTTQGYFNLELNCLGVALFQFQRVPRLDPVCVLAPDDFARLMIKSSVVGEFPDPEDAITWSVACHIPYALLEPHCSFNRPSVGARWRANFYKCADACAHPHWLTWAPIDAQKPDFHRPDAFGSLVFA